MPKRVLGIAGLGGVAVNNYLPFLAKQENWELCLYSRNVEKTRRLAERFHGKVCTTPEELMAEQPDTVFILNREEYHLDLCRTFLPFRPKRLFVEKPLSARNGQSAVSESDYFEARDFLQEAETAGTGIAMDFNYRFFDQTLRLRRLAEEKNFGKLQQSSWFVNYACWSHMIDLLLCLSEGVSTISGCTSEKIFSTGLEPAVDISGAFRTINGGSGTILGTAGTAFQLPLYRVSLAFERATVAFSDLDSSLTIYENDSDNAVSYSLNSNKSRWDCYGASFERSIGAYLESIVKNETPPVSGLDGLCELQFEAALRRAAATGQTVRLEKDFPITTFTNKEAQK